MLIGIYYLSTLAECFAKIDIENININVMMNFTDILKEYDYYVTDGTCDLKDPKLQMSSCHFAVKRPQIHECTNKQLQTRLIKEYSVYIDIILINGEEES